MDNFAAIDFETANNERTSVCSVGVVIVKDGEIVDKFYSLIHPEPDYYLYWNTCVHGLQETVSAPLDFQHGGRGHQGRLCPPETGNRL